MKAQIRPWDHDSADNSLNYKMISRGLDTDFGYLVIGERLLDEAKLFSILQHWTRLA